MRFSDTLPRGPSRSLRGFGEGVQNTRVVRQATDTQVPTGTKKAIVGASVVRLAVPFQSAIPPVVVDLTQQRSGAGAAIQLKIGVFQLFRTQKFARCKQLFNRKFARVICECVTIQPYGLIRKRGRKAASPVYGERCLGILPALLGPPRHGEGPG